MKKISQYITEGEYEDIVSLNLSEISDEDITNDVRDYEGDNLSQVDILNTWNELKEKLANKPQAWVVSRCADIDEYDKKCKQWAVSTIKKYNITKCKNLEKIMTGIAWVMNGI